MTLNRAEMPIGLITCLRESGHIISETDSRYTRVPGVTYLGVYYYPPTITIDDAGIEIVNTYTPRGTEWFPPDWEETIYDVSRKEEVWGHDFGDYDRYCKLPID